jgi:P4 family phage/plasmid primase-like protien
MCPENANAPGGNRGSGGRGMESSYGYSTTLPGPVRSQGMTPTIPSVQRYVRKYLRALYGDDAPGYLILFTTKPERAYPFSLDEIDSVVELAESLSERQNVYAGVGLQGKAPKSPSRGTSETVLTLPGIWFDVDIAGPAHAQTALPRNQDEAKLILDAVPVRPTMLVDSGHGLYPWWLFKEPWVLETDEERKRAQSLVERFQHKLKSRASEHGWKIDGTADLARVLRVPGTVNRKLEPKPVRVLEYDELRRYEPNELEEFLPDEESLGWTDGPRADDKDFDPAPLEPILNGCSWLRHCRDDAASLTEPEWYAMLGIVGRCQDGHKHAHEFSSSYNTYTPSETDRKLKHALDAAGPRTCAYIKTWFDSDDAHCAQCPHSGSIKSPITLGRRAQSIPLKRKRTFKHTDLGNAERMIARHGDKILYSYELGSWLVWNGRMWKPDNAGQIEQLAKDTVRGIDKEVLQTDSEEYRKELRKHANRSEHMPRLRAMIDGARSEVPVLIDDLDTDPWFLNVENGTIDLRTGTLRPHDPADHITKIAPVQFDPGADCPKFLAFLDRITGENAELVAYLQRLLGYCLTGDTREQVFPIAWGTGANGKSTLYSTLLYILGDYGAQTPTTTLVQRKGDMVPNDLAALRGRRFVLASEVDDGHRLSESLVKQITGGDRISARFMRGEWFEFQPQFKTVLATNHKPVIRGTDHAIWRRIHLIPFTVTIPPDEQDATLVNKLRSEAPGILAWLVDGCLFWQSDGLRPPEIVQNATQAYRDDQDTLEQWIRSECVVREEVQVRIKPLYENYRKWAEQSGEEPLSQRQWSERLTERGFERKRTGHAWYRHGIGLLGQGEGV